MLGDPTSTTQGHRSIAAAVDASRRPYCYAGEPPPAIPVDDFTRPKVELGELSPLDAIPATGEPPPHREPTAAAFPCPNSGQGLMCEPPILFKGLDARLHFLFLFLLENSKLVNSFKNRRKIRKMQTQLFWNLCK